MYWIQEMNSNKNASNYHLYMCDNLSDIEKLPTHNKQGVPQEGDSACCYITAIGSECDCLEDGSHWALNSAGVWKSLPQSGSGGGQGGQDEGELATDQEVDEMLDDVFGG